MAASTEHRIEEIFEGRGVTLHVAPSGIARARRRTGRHDDASALAEYREVKETRILGGAPATLVVDFGGARDNWSIDGMRRSQAEWAKRAIDQYVRAAQRRKLPLHAAKLPVEEVRAQIGRLLHQPPLDITDLADAILSQAVFHQASDVHLLPGPRNSALRWRVDGMVQDIVSI